MKAKKVIAIEVNETAHKSAVQMIKENNLGEIISVHHGFSDEIKLEKDEKCDIIIHEIIGEIASCEGIYYTIQDAFSRFLIDYQRFFTSAAANDNDHMKEEEKHESARKWSNDHNTKQVISIPYRVQTFVTVAEFPDLEYWQSIPDKIILPKEEMKSLNLVGFPLSHFLCMEKSMPKSNQLNSNEKENENENETCNKYEPLFAKWEDIIFENPIKLCDELIDYNFEITKNEGILCGLLTYIKVFVDAESPDAELNSHPLHKNTVWPNKLILFKDKIPVKKGDIVTISAKSRLTTKQPTYEFWVHKK